MYLWQLPHYSIIYMARTPTLNIQSTILVKIVCTRHASALRLQLAPVYPELESLPGWLREHLGVGRRARPNQRTEEGYPKPFSGKTFLILLKVEKFYSNVYRVVIILFNKFFLHFLIFFPKKSQISRIRWCLLISIFYRLIWCSSLYIILHISVFHT